MWNWDCDLFVLRSEVLNEIVGGRDEDLMRWMGC